MRVRTKLATDELPECIIVSADNSAERDKLRGVYEHILKIISELNGKPILPYNACSQKQKKIPTKRSTEIRKIK